MLGQKKKQLLRKGLSCGKSRRRAHENDTIDCLMASPWFRTSLLLLLATGIGFLLLWQPPSSMGGGLPPLRLGVVIALFFIASLIQLRLNHRELWDHSGHLILVYSSIFVHVALARAALFLAQRANGSDIPDWDLMAIPYAFSPMVLSLLMGRKMGIFAAIYGGLLTSFFFPAPKFIIALLCGISIGYVAVLATRSVNSRNRLLRAGIMFGLAGLAVSFLLELSHWAALTQGTLPWNAMLTTLFLPLIVALATALLVSGLLPVLESLFQITTRISWLELADLNHPLMRRMSMEAPGTYHHSLMVANLAEAAAEAVGASASMCRVCSYFHDIGKIDKASYFIENMNQDHNLHDDLTPTMSALVIISHVKDGVDMALKHRLNWRIIDVIEQHHGTSSVYFFYRKALTQRENLLKAAAEGKGNKDDIPEIREESFRYPGPRPQSREAAIISLADSIESASRTLEKPTPQKIATLVEEIIFNRLKEGQLSECELSMREINLIRQSFISSLRSMMHNRIAYPKEDKQHAKGEQQRGSKRYQSGQIGHPGHTGPIRLPTTPAREQTSSAAVKAPEPPPVDAEKTGEPPAPVEKESTEEAKAAIETMVPRSLWSMM